VAHLSRGAKGGALEVDGLDEHLPPIFPGASSIVDSGLPRPVPRPELLGDPVGILSGARSETDTLFTLSLQGLSLSIQTTYK
jgi:hypothetical protein